jgi:uncharacterized protein YoxC
MQDESQIYIAVIVALSATIAYLYKQGLKANFRTTQVMQAAKEGFNSIASKVEGVWISTRHEIELQNRSLDDIDEVCSEIHKTVIEIKEKMIADEGSKKTR